MLTRPTHSMTLFLFFVSYGTTHRHCLLSLVSVLCATWAFPAVGLHKWGVEALIKTESVPVHPSSLPSSSPLYVGPVFYYIFMTRSFILSFCSCSYIVSIWCVPATLQSPLLFSHCNSSGGQQQRDRKLLLFLSISCLWIMSGYKGIVDMSLTYISWRWSLKYIYHQNQFYLDF